MDPFKKAGDISDVFFKTFFIIYIYIFFFKSDQSEYSQNWEFSDDKEKKIS